MSIVNMAEAELKTADKADIIETTIEIKINPDIPDGNIRVIRYKY